MGAASSVLVEGTTPEGISKEEKTALEEISNLLKAYNITTKEDIQAVNEQLTNLQAEGIHGIELLQGLHKAMHKIANKESLDAADAMADAVVKARERVRILMRQVGKEKFVNYMVGVDGSPGAEMAYEVCLQELIKSKDGIIAAHCYDSTKEDESLDARYKPEALKEKLDIDLTARSNMGRFKLMWWNKRGEKTAPFVVKTINDMCKKREKLPVSERPSFFISGLTGRKKAGQKSKHNVGSLSLLAAGHLLIPNIVIKLEPIVDRPRIFVMCLKSVNNIAPYELTLDLVKPGNGDIVYVLYIYNDDKVRVMEQEKTLKQFNQYFGQRLKEDGLVKNGSKFLPIMNGKGEPVYKVILKQCEELSADYVVINPHVQVDGAFLPNSAEKILIEAECNVVLCHK